MDEEREKSEATNDLVAQKQCDGKQKVENPYYSTDGEGS